MIAVTNPNSQQMLKQHSNEFKINISKTGITVSVPQALTKGILNIELFTVAGKRIYSATHQAQNGALNIPLMRFSTGTYLISIKGGNASLSSPFVVTR
jgi:hypothetical protein